MLSKNERAIIDLIEEDPFLSQQAISDKLNINRSTVATLISNLVQKKVLLGKAYVINHPSKIICLGAMNFDRKLTINEGAIAGTSNPGHAINSIGGVGRNISENLGRLGQDVSMISLAGKDTEFDVIKKHSEEYIRFEYVTTLENERTGNYTAILDNKGEMLIAVSDMSIYDKMTLDWIKTYSTVLKAAELIVLDLNIPKDVISYVLHLANQNRIPVIVIPVSSPKMKRLPNKLKGVSWIIVNRDESEAFFNIEAKSKPLNFLAKKWIQSGVQNVVVTDGSHSIYYANDQGENFEKKPYLSSVVKDVTGAGDSFAAGIIYGFMKDFSAEECVVYGMVNAYHTIQSELTVRNNLSESTLKDEVKTLRNKGEK